MKKKKDAVHFAPGIIERRVDLGHRLSSGTPKGQTLWAMGSGERAEKKEAQNLRGEKKEREGGDATSLRTPIWPGVERGTGSRRVANVGRE